VLAESDVLGLVYDHTAKEDIARAVHEAVAAKLGSVASYISLEKDVALVGGVARNAGIVSALQKRFGFAVKVPADPQFAGALGAALIAAE
jgi:activator of 2-hydroxyglutaryl-CoA dehydratase